ncbi:hypothetical protein ACQEV4_35810 [Streptomyces shenzhenensis]|uniref:hypothetical protein n=1 Tax=Streptomyces shenzhenensis TaxID=943815 RepID=UPI003D8F2F97
MDLTPIVTPGAQALVAAIMTDGWERVRGWLAAQWSGRTGEPADEIERRLDDAHRQPAGRDPDDGQDPDDGAARARLTARWTAFLLAAVAERPELLGLVRELGAPAGALHDNSNSNSNSGTVTSLVQSRDVHGGIRLGPGS